MCSTALRFQATIGPSGMSTHAFGLGLHLDGQICRIGCSFCYLGQRAPNGAGGAGERALSPDLLASIVHRMADTGETYRNLVAPEPTSPFRTLSVALSEPARRWRSGLEAIATAAAEHAIPLTITTTAKVVAEDPWVLDGAARVSISIDPEKAGPASFHVVRDG